MTVISETSAAVLYRESVAAEVRAMAARRRVSGRQLAEALDTTAMSVSRRMNGAIAWDVEELAVVARVLRCDVRDLLPRLDSNQEPADKWSDMYALAA